MKYLSFLTILITLLACNADDEEDNLPAVDTPPGIYSGYITPDDEAPENARGMITSDGRVGIVDLETDEFFIGTINSGNMTGKFYSDSTINMTAKITSVTNGVLRGSYSSNSAKGIIDLSPFGSTYQRGASFETIEGVWVDAVNVDLVGISTWVIQSNGDFEITTTFGCTANGAFSLINQINNEYSLTGTVTDCGTFNGQLTGFGFTADTFNNDDTLSMVLESGSEGAYTTPIKQ